MCNPIKDSIRWVYILIWVLIAGGSILLSDVFATIAPQPGGKFPDAYVKYKKAHPEKFKFRGGLRGKVERARAARQKAKSKQLEEKSGPFTAPGSGGSTSASASLAASAAGVVSGTAQIPVILFAYQNVAQPYTAPTLQTVLFGANPSGNLTDYYDEVSYGNLNVIGTVFGGFTLPSNDTVYEGSAGSNGLIPGDSTTGQMIEDALDLADGGVNFSLYDNDGPDGVPNSGDDDGMVDFIALVHPEVGGECGATGGNNMWSHAWNYRYWPSAGNQPYTTDDPASGGGFIQIDEYVIQPALNCAGATIEIGVFAHEFGHAFGIPDLYDTDGSSSGLGHWSLMAGGNWNDPDSPAHWDAWSKSEVGWISPTLLTSQTTGLSIPQAETTDTAFQIVTGNGKYFLIENRQAVGFDSQLTQCGLLIYDIDQTKIEAGRNSNSVNRVENCGTFQQNAPDHYGIALEQADGNCDLEADNNRSDTGDPFPGSTNNTQFNSTSTPSVVNYSGDDPQVFVNNISGCSANMTADVKGFPLPDFGVSAVDVVFLIDVSGSYADDLPEIQNQMSAIVGNLTSTFTDIRFGLATFRDFPFFPFGEATDFAYNPVLPLQNDSTIFETAVSNLVADGGLDLPESQYEALFQVLTGAGRDLTNDGDTNDAGEIAPSDIGWTTGRSRVIYLLTDAPFHDSDSESYPGTTLEAAGRNDVLPLLMPNDPVIFTMVADNPEIFVTQGEGGETPPSAPTQLAQQSQELASETLGGVLSAGPNSTNLGAAIDVTVTALEEGVQIINSIIIDVKPQNSSNRINPSAKGVVPVAVLGSDTLDVLDIDVTTLAFGINQAPPAHKEGGHLQDVNGDGLTDLLSHYRIQDTGIVRGDTGVCLTGQTSDGILLLGCDTIDTSPGRN